jgi:hypothetical protein
MIQRENEKSLTIPMVPAWVARKEDRGCREKSRFSSLFVFQGNMGDS